MKKIWTFVFLVCFVVIPTTWLMAVKTTTPYTISKGIGEWLVPDKTIDEVWSAATKTLLLMHYKIVQADKATGIITARGNPSTITQLFSSSRDVWHKDDLNAPTLTVMIETKENGINVLCNVQNASKIPLKHFCRGLEEALYGVK